MTKAISYSFADMVPAFRTPALLSAVNSAGHVSAYAGRTRTLLTSSLVDDRHRRVVRPPHVVGAGPVDPIRDSTVDEAVGDHVVVDAPTRVVVEGLATLGPPRVRPHLVGATVADHVGPAAALSEHPGHPFALMRQEAGTLVVALVVLQVFFAVRDIPVAADDHLVTRAAAHLLGGLGEELAEGGQKPVLLVLLGGVGRARRQ